MTQIAIDSGNGPDPSSRRFTVIDLLSRFLGGAATDLEYRLLFIEIRDEVADKDIKKLLQTAAHGPHLEAQHGGSAVFGDLAIAGSAIGSINSGADRFRMPEDIPQDQFVGEVTSAVERLVGSEWARVVREFGDEVVLGIVACASGVPFVGDVPSLLHAEVDEGGNLELCWSVVSARPESEGVRVTKTVLKTAVPASRAFIGGIPPRTMRDGVVEIVRHLSCQRDDDGSLRLCPASVRSSLHDFHFENVRSIVANGGLPPTDPGVQAWYAMAIRRWQRAESKGTGAQEAVEE